MFFDQLSIFFDYYRLQNLILFPKCDRYKKNALLDCKVSNTENLHEIPYYRNEPFCLNKSF